MASQQSNDAAQGGLSKELGVPLYHQIQHLIRHRIMSGDYAAGSQIPSENELCRELNVSRVTLREALRELVRDNFLRKVQGKGTFVAIDPPRRLTTVKYSGFLEELQERVLKLAVTEVDAVRVPTTAELRQILQLQKKETEVMVIKRLRHIDDDPFSYTLNYLPVAIGERIPQKDLYSVPLLQILQDDLKIPIVRARETIEAAPADPEIARKLRLPALYPVLHMKRVMYTSQNRPFELVDIYYRADKYHYSVNMRRVKRGGKWTWTTEVETSA